MLDTLASTAQLPGMLHQLCCAHDSLMAHACQIDAYEPNLTQIETIKEGDGKTFPKKGGAARTLRQCAVSAMASPCNASSAHAAASITFAVVAAHRQREGALHGHVPGRQEVRQLAVRCSC